MKQTHIIADAVGRTRMAETLNVGATAVSNAVVAGRFPPSWADVVRLLCEDVGVDCPPDVFGMKPVDSILRVDSLPQRQGHAAGKSAGASS